MAGCLKGETKGLFIQNGRTHCRKQNGFLVQMELTADLMCASFHFAQQINGDRTRDAVVPRYLYGTVRVKMRFALDAFHTSA